MKKLVFMLVAFAAVSFASCGNKTENAGTNDSDSAAQVADTTVKDSAAAPADSAAAPAAADSAAKPKA
ncbi:entericidin [Alloprevotella tannerae]|uniref:PG1828 family lipoprotein n=1 Tax=Alloprevotella tannerae TaxID=76122 RepID=UPI001EDC26EC|nr:entericidin [Alloprevotella tannerae]MCG2651775.1 entericidin [Alloprevotella tannerae]